MRGNTSSERGSCGRTQLADVKGSEEDVRNHSKEQAVHRTAEYNAGAPASMSELTMCRRWAIKTV